MRLQNVSRPRCRHRAAGMTILLEGDLGAGKSTFARGLIRALGHSGPVPSPTYTLVEPYALPAVTVYHVDLYRVSSEDELRFLGWNELDDGLRLVEWPDRAPQLAGTADIRLLLEYDGARSSRQNRWAERARPKSGVRIAAANGLARTLTYRLIFIISKEKSWIFRARPYTHPT